ncbi:MAG: hypothetical protein AB7F23_08120 [Phycisphaerae bacterium]|jgi:hypothetical protein
MLKRICLTALLAALLALAGCENHYTVVTETGLTDLPLSKALKNASSEQELWQLYSLAIDIDDKQKIEKYIEKKYGSIVPALKERDFDSSSDFIEEQNKRRTAYVKGHNLPEEMQAIILSGGYVKGMSRNEFIASRGKPVEETTVTADNGTEYVILREGLFSSRKFYFLDNKLQFWD